MHPGADAPVRVPLNEHLQDVTEALAAAQAPADVFAVVLQTALRALGAVAGAVLFVSAQGNRLEIAATQGHEEGAQTLWQDGPLDGNVPAGDALERHEALYFEHEGDLTRTYPELEARTGGVAAVATAVLPMFLDDAPLGVVILDFREPHSFTPEEQRFLRILASQCAIALGRARLMTALRRQVQERTRHIEEEARAHEAFMVFTEAVGTQTDVHALVRQAITVLRARFSEASVGYYEHAEGLWKLRVWSEDMRADVVARVQAGVPDATPIFARMLGSGEAVFTDAWDPVREQVEATEQYGTVATYPLTVGGEVRGVLAVGLKDTRQWPERDKTLVRAVGRGLTLALDRAEQARQLEVQRVALQDRAEALSLANEELDAFSFSVSHDLRTPVRHIVGFAGLLRKTLGDAPPPKATHYLSVIEGAATRMNTLIDALLDLARTAQHPLRTRSVDLGALFGQARDDLEVELAGRRVEWRVAPLPVVTGDRDILEQVVANLLGNAVKYTRPREVARIEVWAEDRVQEWAVCVRDNGVGFDPRYGERLFGVFQRLHRDAEFEGTGVGLANVRRIVSRHGGTVSAQGTPGEGATFTFTLPKGP